MKNHIAMETYELSKLANTDDDDMFYVVEEYGEVLKKMSHFRRSRTGSVKLAQEMIQAIIQMEKLAYRLGVLDDMWAFYEPELNVLKKKIEESLEEMKK